MLHPPSDHSEPLSWLALLGYAVAGLNQTSLLAAVVTPEIAGEWIQVANTALITIGSTVILLYQRSRAKDRETKEREAAEARDEIVRRLDVLAGRTDRSVDDQEAVHKLLKALTERVDRLPCSRLRDNPNELEDNVERPPVGCVRNRPPGGDRDRQG